MNSYELHQEKRRERLENAADRVEEKAREMLTAAITMMKAIPCGQPILVGHYSEKRDRRFRVRIDDKIRNSVALSTRAEELARRAAAVGTGGISSDDPDVIAKLRQRIEEIERRPKSINKRANIRRIKRRIAYLEKLASIPAAKTIRGDGWTIKDSVEENRIVICFDEKPSREMLHRLRANGFRWSPTRCAHVRMRSGSAYFAAKSLLNVSV